MIKQALHRFVAENQKQFKHDRQLSIGASEIGQCARRTWFSKKGQAIDPGYVDRWGAAKRGQLIEVFWEQAIRAYLPKGTLHYAGRYQRTFFDTASPLSATPDGLIERENGAPPIVIECKTADPRKKVDRLDANHEAQVHVQMGLIRHTTKYAPETAIVCYVDASFLDEITEHEVRFDQGVFDTLRARAVAIMEANSADEIRPEGVIAGGAECEYCPYRASCSAIRVSAVPANDDPLGPEAARQLGQLLQDRAVLKQRIEDTEALRLSIEQSIKDRLREAGTRRADLPGWRVIWSALKGRPSYDMPALREAALKLGLDLGQYETVGNPSDRLDIKRLQP